MMYKILPKVQCKSIIYIFSALFSHGIEESRPTWIGIFSVVVAVLVVIIGFGLPLLLITIKTVDW